MTLYDFIGPWLYWPLVVAIVAGTVTWTSNCISVTWSEGLKQIQEIRRNLNPKE
jgi:hypothetical protein